MFIGNKFIIRNPINHGNNLIYWFELQYFHQSFGRSNEYVKDDHHDQLVEYTSVPCPDHFPTIYEA